MVNVKSRRVSSAFPESVELSSAAVVPVAPTVGELSGTADASLSGRLLVCAASWWLGSLGAGQLGLSSSKANFHVPKKQNWTRFIVSLMFNSCTLG